MEEESEFIEQLVNSIKNKLIIASKAGIEMAREDDILKCWGSKGISIYFPGNPFYFSFFVNQEDWYFDKQEGRHPFNSEEWKQLLVDYFAWMQNDYGVFIKPPEKNLNFP